MCLGSVPVPEQNMALLGIRFSSCEGCPGGGGRNLLALRNLYVLSFHRVTRLISREQTRISKSLDRIHSGMVVV